MTCAGPNASIPSCDCFGRTAVIDRDRSGSGSTYGYTNEVEGFGLWWLQDFVERAFWISALATVLSGPSRSAG